MPQSQTLYDWVTKVYMVAAVNIVTMFYGNDATWVPHVYFRKYIYVK